MCSQPPTANDDSWLFERALAVVDHIGEAPRVLGLTGGEPLLLGARLKTILDAISHRHPSTYVEVLTNGRLLANGSVEQAILSPQATEQRVRWLVPLYGNADFLHDFVVQAPGAFEETLAGLLTLRRHEQAVQLRTVLIEPVMRSLPQFCEFVGRNLPFVQQVALMACEPTGYALANRDLCSIDLGNWWKTLELASRTLKRFGVPMVIMNTPLCALPPSLWPAAQQSISDWKNVYALECSTCSVRSQCSGLFTWHDRGWKPAAIRPVEESIV
jgi:His-Xaa-Ser system radical SAM maturase HxsC